MEAYALAWLNLLLRLAKFAACHAQRPQSPRHALAAQTKGMMLETDARIRQQAALIAQQSVLTRVMPPGNLTAMTDDERDLIARWAAGEPSR